MLQEFSVGNFWSFRDMQTLQMQAAKTVSKYPRVDINNVAVLNDKLTLLKTKAIYGANASGKTNLLRAFVVMMQIIRDCLKDVELLKKKITPFALNEVSRLSPTFFQIVFVLDNTIYRYGFECTNEEITSEWLFGKTLNSTKVVKERYYFTREGMDVRVNNKTYKEGKVFASKKDKPPLYRDNSLFLSVIATWNGQIAKNILEYFQKNITLLLNLPDSILFDAAFSSMFESKYGDKTTELLQAVDPTIQRIEAHKVDFDTIAQDKDLVELKEEMMRRGKNYAGDLLIYRKGEKQKEIGFLMSETEAEGTKKIFSFSPWIFATLDKGGILIIDEFDAKMHPNLTRKIIELFHTPHTNPNNAQLLFVTHDTNLLDAKLLRRDQISFAKKDKEGATEIYSLIDFKGVRNDASFEKDYLLGKYEAVPTNLNFLEDAIQPYITHAKKDK